MQIFYVLRYFLGNHFRFAFGARSVRHDECILALNVINCLPRICKPRSPSGFYRIIKTNGIKEKGIRNEVIYAAKVEDFFTY